MTDVPDSSSDVAWDMVRAQLDRIEQKQDRFGNDLHDLNIAVTSIKTDLAELNGQVKKNTDFQYEHKRHHGLVRGREPDPEIAPTYMMAKRHPIRALIFAFLGVCGLLGMSVPEIRTWLFANGGKLLTFVGF